MTGSRGLVEGRRAAGFIASAILFLGLIYYLGTHGSIGRGGYPFMGAYLLAHLAMVGLWLFWPSKRGGFAVILLLAVAARVLMYPFPVSDDVNRYLWEGRIQEEGFNPYAIAPDKEELRSLRDENWQGINHKDLTTVYPPAAQIAFRICYALWPHKQGLKLLFILFDLGIVLVLSRLALAYGMETRHLLLYALNPLVLLYVAGEGHLDPAAVFFAMAALLALKSGRNGPAFFLLGMGVMFKMVPLILLPLLIRRDNWKKAFFFLLPFASFLPFLDAGLGLVKTPALFAGTFYYNAFLFSLLQPFLSNAVAIALCWLAFVLVAIAILFLVPDTFRACYLMTGALLLTLPVVHQWYFVMIAPFLPFFRPLPWLVLFAGIAPTFITRIHQFESGVWYDAPLARTLEYGSLLALWIWGLKRGRVAGPVSHETPGTVSAIVPVLNEAEHVCDCIASVREQRPRPLEIIVVDGGSKDGTQDRVLAMEDVSLLLSEQGRGNQIAAGAAQARGDVILVLHGDSVLEAGAIGRMLESLASNPAAVGGAFGHVYQGGALKTAFIALLDNLRARVLGLSFGNQAQFFRRRSLPEGFPRLHLMEDVELSFRMQTAGAVLFVPRGVRNRPRRWGRGGYLTNICTVLSLCGRFIVRRRFGLISGDGREFYERYYGR